MDNVIDEMYYNDPSINLTWKDLKDFLDKMPIDRLEDNVTVFGYDNEYYPISKIKKITETDVLDEGAYVLEVR